MDQPVKTFNSDGGDTTPVVLDESSLLSSFGEALWGPDRFCHGTCGRAWLEMSWANLRIADLLHAAAYNIRTVRFCVRVLYRRPVAAVLNYFFQRPSARESRGRRVRSTVNTGPIGWSPAATSSALTETAPPQFGITPAVADGLPAQEVRMYPVFPSILSRPLQKPRLHRLTGARGEACSNCFPPRRPSRSQGRRNPCARAKGRASQAEKPKNVYYNIVGNPCLRMTTKAEV